MKDQLRIEYEEWANYISRILQEERSWVRLYKDYAVKLVRNQEGYREARRKFREPTPLHAYLSVGRAKENKKEFDLRYVRYENTKVYEFYMKGILGGTAFE